MSKSTGIDLLNLRLAVCRLEKEVAGLEEQLLMVELNKKLKKAEQDKVDEKTEGSKESGNSEKKTVKNENILMSVAPALETSSVSADRMEFANWNPTMRPYELHVQNPDWRQKYGLTYPLYFKSHQRSIPHILEMFDAFIKYKCGEISPNARFCFFKEGTWESLDILKKLNGEEDPFRRPVYRGRIARRMTALEFEFFSKLKELEEAKCAVESATAARTVDPLLIKTVKEATVARRNRRQRKEEEKKTDLITFDGPVRIDMECCTVTQFGVVIESQYKFKYRM